MFDKKRVLVCMICLYVIGVVSCFPILANPKTLTPFTVIAPMSLIVAIAMTVVYVKLKKKKSEKNAEIQSVQPTEADLLMLRYKAIKFEDLCEEGFVKFTNEDLTFAATGKYYIEKNFNGKKGYHLAIEISGTELVKTPDDYSDVLDYESNLFKINIGYFDGIALSTPENDNGVILAEDDRLQGVTIYLEQNSGYIFSIDTVESDDVDYGQIKVLEWNSERHIIAFKCIVADGVADVICGKIDLQYDAEAQDY